MTIEELINKGEGLFNQTYESAFFGDCIDFDNYEEWRRLALLFLQQAYPNHPQTATFENYVNQSNEVGNCRILVSILKAFKEIKPKPLTTDYNVILDTLFNHFPICVRQLQRRYNNRAPFVINDEYDVQDLLHALFRLHFDDVRPEEWMPSYAGSSKRMDFLLNDAEIAVEVKMTRKGLTDKEIGDQLIIDIAHYKKHPDCNMLYCYIYDPDGYIRNPRGLEKDLDTLEQEFKVKTYIRPFI